MILTTERLALRKLLPTDLDNLAQTLQDPAAMTAYAHAFSDEEVKAWLANNLRRYQEDGYGLWAVIRQQDGAFLGQCGLTKQQVGDQTVCEIGYLFARQYWHQGYAIEAAQGVKAYAFHVLNQPAVWSIIRDTNLASMNVAIRNGMLVRRRIIKHYYGQDMPHLCFCAEAEK